MEKVSLPIKTKIATWWIKLAGIGTSIMGIFYLIGGFLCIITPAGPMSAEKEFLLIKISFLICLLGGFIFFLGLQLRKGKKWAYFVIFLFYFFLLGLNFSLFTRVEETIPEHFHINHLLNFLLIPLILLLLDRKNFWKIAT